MDDSKIKPLVSFCMSTFKRGQTLLHTCKSIQRQTYSNFEVVISDNDPEGGGKVWIDQLNDNRFKYFKNSSNLGMKPSFNKSIERSTGEYIVMIADDDPVYFDMLETLVNLLQLYPEKGMYLGGCDWFCVDPETAKLYNMKLGTNSCISSILPFGHIQDFSATEFLLQFFSFKYYPHYLWSCCLIKKEIINNFGGTPDYGTPYLGDYAYLSTMGSVNGAVMINKALGCQTLHNENFGRNQHDQLVIVSKNLPSYFIPKIALLPDADLIKKAFYKFLGMSMVSHISFLFNYFKKDKTEIRSLKEAEKNVFELPHMKPFHTKLLIKKKFPYMHDAIVKLKKKFIVAT